MPPAAPWRFLCVARFVEGCYSWSQPAAHCLGRGVTGRSQASCHCGNELVLRFIQDNFSLWYLGQCVLSRLGGPAVLPRSSGSMYTRNMANALLFERFPGEAWSGEWGRRPESVTVVSTGATRPPPNGIAGSTPFLILLGHALLTGLRYAGVFFALWVYCLPAPRFFNSDIKLWYAFRAVSAMLFPTPSRNALHDGGVKSG